MPVDSIQLGVFASRVSAICEEMGAVLARQAVSPNIRDRQDYSCALFDAAGDLLGQATHIPVHLGSMAFAMTDLASRHDWRPGRVMILNDPFAGGTHLPDVTLITPVFRDQTLRAFAVSRAHYADIGAVAPGSMPVSGDLADEGLLISPTWLFRDGELDRGQLDQLLAEVREPALFEADLQAQVSACGRGHGRLLALIEEIGETDFDRCCEALQAYTERLTRSALSRLPRGAWCFQDWLEDDGLGHQDIAIRLCLTVDDEGLLLDFSGTSGQVEGNVNCPLAVTAAAVFYVIRCLLPAQLPMCAGALRPIRLRVPQGSVLNVRYPAAVAAGNVETSQRVVDVVLGALAQVLPERIPAAAQGTMNNIAMGDEDWNYYETLGGGAGGGPQYAGLSGFQVHMTNTLNTPVEVLERHFPLRIESYALRVDSGGSGQYVGGDGICRRYRFLAPATVTLISERRRLAPWGLHGGADGQAGHNQLDGDPLPAKCALRVSAGAWLEIATPGGGGYGTVPRD